MLVSGSEPHSPPVPAVKAGVPITYEMVAQAIAEFEFTLTFANAPIDRFARGEPGALTVAEKQGALLFFGTARCSVCHSVAGQSNEMVSDFQKHVLGVPQIAPSLTNAALDGPGLNEDFGLEQITGSPADRYKFRTSPLRNVAVQPTFMHNGDFTRLDDAIRHHLNVTDSALHYTTASQNLPTDLSGPLGPMAPVLARLDPRATPARLRHLIPHTVPSGRPMLVFEFP